MSRDLSLVESSGEPRNFERASASGSLLETKLYAPRARSDLVPRPRLTEVLRLGAGQKLTVVIAPAGFGKTTLLAGWLGEQGEATAWVSLDANDNEPALFWKYFVRALQGVRADIGWGGPAPPEPPPPPPTGRGGTH